MKLLEGETNLSQLYDSVSEQLERIKRKNTSNFDMLDY